MNIILHYPKTPEDIRILREKAAITYVMAVKQYLKQLSCPKEQKLQLLKEIQNKYTTPKESTKKEEQG